MAEKLSTNGQPISLSEVSKLSLKDEYDLKERCGKRAAEVFKKDWGNGISNDNNSSSFASFSNHFNKKLNKCFYLITSKVTNYASKNTYHFITLVVINDNNIYGELIDDGDKVGGKVETVTFHSKKEWEALIKPFMND